MIVSKGTCQVLKIRSEHGSCCSEGVQSLKEKLDIETNLGGYVYDKITMKENSNLSIVG